MNKISDKRSKPKIKVTGLDQKILRKIFKEPVTLKTKDTRSKILWARKELGR